MEKEPKQPEEEKTEEEQVDSKDSSKEEIDDIEELKEVIKKLEKMHKETKKKPRRRIIAIEFGGVFHHNRIINFIFTFILTFTIAFFINEIFNFATYRDIMYLVGIIFIFNLVEETIKYFVLVRYFQIILRTFGTVFYFVYLLIFFVLDQYLFVRSFNFVNEIGLPFFVLILASIRYVFGQIIRNYLRYLNVR